jgi:hypothetical protein
MAPFRWKKVEYDLALCKQFVGDKPDKPEKWDALATVLEEVFTKEDCKVQLTGRGCREHLMLLIKKFKTEDAKALKRSVRPVIFQIL